jgi:hypothetical protein
MSHQHTDAQNEGRSYNSRKHERLLGLKSIKEDEHMHSQKKSEIRRDLTETRCALATPTCLQHPERLAEARSALISSAPPLGSHHHDQCGQYRAHDHENADDLPSLFFMTRHCCRPPGASHQPQQGRYTENGKRSKPAHHGEHLFVPTRHRAPPTLPCRPVGKVGLFHRKPSSGWNRGTEA